MTAEGGVLATEKALAAGWLAESECVDAGSS